MAMEIRILRSGDESVLRNVAAGVFDHAVDMQATREFLDDPRHHLVVAIDDGLVIGMASAVHYIHPDKPAPELFVNEIGVAGAHQRRGIGRDLLRALLAHGDELGCSNAWVLTERSNEAAAHLFRSEGSSESDEVRAFTFSRALLKRE